MAQNITLLGASYSDVPSVLLPKTGGGQASFTDVTDTTAAAADVAQGKYFYTSAGVRTEGTSTGGGGTEAGTVTQDANGFLVLDDDPPAGQTLITKSITANGTYNASSDNADGYSSVTVNVSGGSGLVYETGTWTPTEDAYQTNIYFTGTYSILPFSVMLYDTGSTAPAASSIVYWGIHNWYSLDGSTYASSTSTNYARVNYSWTNSSGQSTGGQFITGLNGSTNTEMNQFLQLDHFRAYTSSSSRFYRSGRTYKWIAVWAPTS